MDAIRQICESVPDTITIPPELRRRRVEVIILPLDNEQTGWSRLDKEIMEFFGSIPGSPDREQQGEYEERKDLS